VSGESTAEAAGPSRTPLGEGRAPWYVASWALPTGSPRDAQLRAREILREVLDAAGVADVEAFEAETAVAELAINAVQHGKPPCELRVVYVGEHWPVWCELADAGSPLQEPVSGRVVQAQIGQETSSQTSGKASSQTSGDDDGPVAGWATSADAVDLDVLIAGLSERGRGLELVRGLSGRYCATYPTGIGVDRTPGKAIGLALPCRW
jgi:hypothetical protein